MGQKVRKCGWVQLIFFFFFFLIFDGTKSIKSGWVDLAVGTSACLPSLIPDDQDEFLKMTTIIHEDGDDYRNMIIRE